MQPPSDYEARSLDWLPSCEERPQPPQEHVGTADWASASGPQRESRSGRPEVQILEETAPGRRLSDSSLIRSGPATVFSARSATIAASRFAVIVPFPAISDHFPSQQGTRRGFENRVELGGTHPQEPGEDAENPIDVRRKFMPPGSSTDY